jgi:hypothetical protein
MDVLELRVGLMLTKVMLQASTRSTPATTITRSRTTSAWAR